MVSSNELKTKMFYFAVFKKQAKAKCIASTKYANGKFYCCSPFVDTTENTFSYNEKGWQDTALQAGGTAEDFICDILEIERGSIDIHGYLAGLGVSLPGGKTAVCTYEDLLELDLPAPETWLGGFISPGEATLLVALPGVGKTWFTMAIAQILADGSHSFATWKPKGKRRTLLVDFEMQPNRIRFRLELLRKGYGLQDTQRDIGILCPELAIKNGFTFNNLGEKDQIKLLYESFADYDVIIIDNINAAYPTAEDDENSPKFWVGPQNLVMGLRQTGKACVMVHHATKGDPKNPAGSGKNVRFFDNVLALVDTTDYTKSDTKKVKVHIKKSRNFPISRETQPELELQDIGSGCYWREVSGMVIPEFKRDVSSYLNNEDKDDIPF